MLKKIIILSITLLLLGSIGVFFVVAPYHIYTLTLTEGVHTQFLIMAPSPAVFYDGHDLVADKTGTHEDNSLYSVFHLSNFYMPMPYNHPVFYMIPMIKSESSGPRLGASFQDGKNAELVSFMVERSYKFETDFGDQKLFLLPMFKNHIHRKSESVVWKDLFSKKLTLPSNLGYSFIESLLALKEVTYSDLVYNLYILYNRTRLFPPESERISFDEKSNHGVIELKSEDPKFKIERLFILEKGLIYSLTVKTRLQNTVAANFRNKLLFETSYKSSTPDSAIPIYAQYKTITYNNRVDQQGMSYLFSAWSHDLSNREYIRVIILFLERGRSNLKFLKPFYEYAYKKFGSNLSGDTDQLVESAEEKIKRKTKEELQEEINKEEQKNGPKNEGNFSTNDEKVKFYLQKAKENKVNSDHQENILIEE